MKTDIPETVIHTSYVPWLARVDALIGRLFRGEAGTLARRRSCFAGDEARRIAVKLSLQVSAHMPRADSQRVLRCIVGCRRFRLSV